MKEIEKIIIGNAATKNRLLSRYEENWGKLKIDSKLEKNWYIIEGEKIEILFRIELKLIYWIYHIDLLAT